jgi:lambda family phage portal protein
MNLFSIFRREAPEATTAAPATDLAATEDAPRTRHTWRRALARAWESHFSGSNNDRLTASWPSTPVPADWIITRHQRVLVARSRQQCTENGYARQFLRLCRQNIIGPHGIQLRPQVTNAAGELDEAINSAIQAAWKEWGKKKNCDVAGKKSWRNFELSAVQNAGKDGEFMFRKIYGPAAGPWGFALQYIDPQRCPVVELDVSRTTAGTFIRHGIEFNRYGRPLAYFFTTDNEAEADYFYGGRHYVRVPADEIIHGFKDELGGQKRGLPWIATGIYKLRHVGGMEDAAVVNARVGAAKMGVIEWEENTGPELDEDEELEIDAEAGTFPVLPEGARLKEWNPQYPSGEFAPFTKHLLRAIAAGWGVLYNTLANDLEGVNFSSIRQGTLDERERWKEDQEWIAEALHQEVFESWLAVALLSGRIKVKGQPLQATSLERCQAVEWQPRRWTWIDPGADVKAAVDSKNNLLKSPGEIVREGGRDPSAVYREIARDIREMQAAGIPDEYIKLAFGQKLEPAAKPKKEEATA